MPAAYEDIEYEWECGKCGGIVPFTEDPPQVCPYCGWIHGRRRDVTPDKQKLKIHR